MAEIITIDLDHNKSTDSAYFKTHSTNSKILKKSRNFGNTSIRTLSYSTEFTGQNHYDMLNRLKLLKKEYDAKIAKQINSLNITDSKIFEKMKESSREYKLRSNSKKSENLSNKESKLNTTKNSYASQVFFLILHT